MTDAATQSAQEVNIDKQRLGAIYAKALLGAMEPQGRSEEVVGELDALIDEALQIAPQLELTLASPRVAVNEKSNLLDRVFGGRLSDSILTFLKVLARHGRLDCLRQIRRAAHDELNRLRNRLSVAVTTAEPIQDEMRERIRGQLQTKLGRDVVLECRVDPEIVGGMIVRIGDTVYDSSIANKLAKIKEETLNKTALQLREATDRFAVSS
ncbi:MAG: ATP synthase F1 subunit delta [Planctomycetales bacterium]|nr:ATP synthase F1 subunit delta [Planctomycetales bacterium]